MEKISMDYKRRTLKIWDKVFKTRKPWRGFFCVVLLAGHGGRVTSGMSLSAYVVKNLALEMKDDSHPREAILKHAKVNYIRKNNVR